VLLAGEAVIHVQQYVELFHGVRWIGPLFLLDAAACVVAIAGLWHARTWRLAAVMGVAVSALALAGLIVSYGVGLFGWQESGLRPAMAFAVVCELGAVLVLPAALAAAGAQGRSRVASIRRAGLAPPGLPIDG
jgi:hypothetical protein